MSHLSARLASTAYAAAAEALRPNAGQWAVYESDSHCVVQAGPGSGKTKTITIKMARMLAEDVRFPRGVICITYSTECARELKRRLANLGVSEHQNVFIGTIHTFCLKHVLIPYSKLAGLHLPDPVRVASKRDRLIALEIVLDREVGRNEPPEDWLLRVETYRRTHLDRTSESWTSDEEVARVTRAYEDELHRSGYIDFDDMTLYGLHLIENHAWIRKLLKARFPVMVIDEYQDLGKPLHRIVLSLALTAGVRVLAVGDPDQSIYGFAGAQPELLDDLSQQLQVKPIELQLNYRCGRTIVQAAKTALGEDRNYDVPPTAHIGTIDFYGCKDGPRQQIEVICNELLPAALARREGRRLGDVALLYIDKYDGDLVAEIVATAGYAFVSVDQNAPYPKTPFTRWMEECAAWCSGGWQYGEPRLSELIKTWLTFNRTVSSDAQRLFLKRCLVRFLFTSRQPDLLLSNWLDVFRTTCLQSEFDRGIELRDEQEVFDRIRSAAAPGGKLAHFAVAAFAGQGGSPDHLNLITLHSAKGSEFDVVFMVGLEEGRLPWRNAGPLQLREQRRLFYVGLTRARHEVHLLCSGWYERRGFKHQYGPSRWVMELYKSLPKPEMSTTSS